MFEHKNIHNETWRCKDGRTRNQIDHILSDAGHASNVIEERSLKGANGDSDQMLVRSKVRMRLFSQKNKKAGRFIKWNTFKNPKQKENSILNAAEKSTGERRNIKRKDWFDEEKFNLLIW